MEAKELDEIEARANTCTEWAPDECELTATVHDDGEGPYTHYWAPQGATLGSTLVMLGDDYEGSGKDWRFLAHARQDVPRLVAAVRSALGPPPAWTREAPSAEEDAGWWWFRPLDTRRGRQHAVEATWGPEGVRLWIGFDELPEEMAAGRWQRARVPEGPSTDEETP